jgi:hypothetical protein
MPLDAPLRLGPFLVDMHGRLEPGEPGRFPSFRLVWRGCAVLARLDGGWQDGGAAAELVLSAIVGRVPSTAGGDPDRNRARRAEAFTALRWLGRGNDTLPLRLLPDHRVVIESRRTIEVPVSAIDLLTQSTCFLLDLGPYLDLLSEEGVPVEAAGPIAPGSAGIAKTCPG